MKKAECGSGLHVVLLQLQKRRQEEDGRGRGWCCSGWLQKVSRRKERAGHRVTACAGLQGFGLELRDR